MKAKEALIRRSAFLKPLPNPIKPAIISCGMAHKKITKETVAQALITQVATKAFRPDKINSWILKIILSWEKIQITNMIYHAIQQGYHLIK